MADQRVRLGDMEAWWWVVVKVFERAAIVAGWGVLVLVLRGGFTGGPYSGGFTGVANPWISGRGSWERPLVW